MENQEGSMITHGNIVKYNTDTMLIDDFTFVNRRYLFKFFNRWIALDIKTQVFSQGKCLSTKFLRLKLV